MKLIPTYKKEKLPKGFSYPLGAEMISIALEPILNNENSELIFWRQDEYWTSKYQNKINSKGKIEVLRVQPDLHSGSFTVHISSVPSEYNHCLKQIMQKQALSRLHSTLEKKQLETKRVSASIVFDLKTKSCSIE